MVHRFRLERSMRVCFSSIEMVMRGCCVRYTAFRFRVCVHVCKCVGVSITSSFYREPGDQGERTKAQKLHARRAKSRSVPSTSDYRVGMAIETWCSCSLIKYALLLLQTQACIGFMPPLCRLASLFAFSTKIRVKFSKFMTRDLYFIFVSLSDSGINVVLKFYVLFLVCSKFRKKIKE